ncbi:TIR domain-containing protein [bacterium]|nr:TIR domain-containing protein [bacterium]
MSSYDVFVSHSSRDAEIAQLIVQELERQGWKCWVAPRDIAPGTTWAAAIVQGLDQSRVMVLVYSPAADQSQQVLREIQRAVTRNMPILPFRLQDFAMSQEMQYFLGTTHWLNAYPPPLPLRVNQLAEAVRGLLNRPQAATSAPVGLQPIVVQPFVPPVVVPVTPMDQWDAPEGNGAWARFWRWLNSG